MRRLAAACLSLALSVSPAWADVDALLYAMQVRAIITAFALEGEEAGTSIDRAFLDGQGGNVWAETVRRLYDPERLETELRAVVKENLDPDVAAQALLFFDSELGRNIVDLEVQARQAMLNPELEAAALRAGVDAADDIVHMIELRDLITRNTDTAVAAQDAFFAGLIASGAGPDTAPNTESQRAAIERSTEEWLRGYYALAQSPLSADDRAIYSAFWDTEVGEALDEVLYTGFGASYTALSFALGQAAGRLAPQNEL